jgi:hypothetical protein
MAEDYVRSGCGLFFPAQLIVRRCLTSTLIAGKQSVSPKAKGTILTVLADGHVVFQAILN